MCWGAVAVMSDCVEIKDGKRPPFLSLSTERLLLRPVLAEDAEWMVANLDRLDIARWLAKVPHPYTEVDFADFLSGIAVPGETFAICDVMGAVGCIQFGSELGYWIAPLAQGQGYATEAASGLLAAWFAAGGGAIRSGYFEGNDRSARVLAKLGFFETGRRLVACRALDRALPHVDLVLTAPAWAQRMCLE